MWAPAANNRIAVERVSPEGGPALKARLEYERGEFRQIRIAEIRESLRDSPGALKSFAIKQPARMRGYTKAIRVSYQIPRGEPAILWRVNHWLARRKGPRLDGGGALVGILNGEAVGGERRWLIRRGRLGG